MNWEFTYRSSRLAKAIDVKLKFSMNWGYICRSNGHKKSILHNIQRLIYPIFETGSLQDFLKAFRVLLALLGIQDGLKCRGFPFSLSLTTGHWAQLVIVFLKNDL